MVDVGEVGGVVGSCWASPGCSIGVRSSSSGNQSDRVAPRKRNLRDLYEVTERQDNLTLFFLFADCEPVSFQEAAQEKKWRDAMDEEIKAIEKNDTWELVSLPKGHTR